MVSRTLTVPLRWAALSLSSGVSGERRACRTEFYFRRSVDRDRLAQLLKTGACSSSR